GLGMPPPDIAAANRRLAGAESFTIAPSKYLGHYVAGNLAARHGIRVTLANAPDAGIAATVAVPADLLTDDEARGAPVTPPHGHHAPAPTGAAARPRPAAPPAPLAPRSPSLEVAPDEPPGAGPAAEERSGRDDTRTLAPTAGGRALPAPSASGPGAGDASPVPPTDGAPPRSPTGPAPRTAPAPPPRPGGGGPRTTRVPDTRLGRTPGGLVRRVPVVSDRPPPEPARDRAVVASLARYVPDRPPVGPGPDGPIPPPSPGTDPAGGGDRPATGPAPEPAVAVAATMAPGIGGVPPLPARVRPDGPPRTAGPGRLGAGTGGVEPVGVEPGDAGPARAPMPAGAGVLARRVPGAQLPQAGLVPLRRGGGEPSGPLPVPAGGQPGPAVATSTAADRASEVYALLSDFTAGVQRGLTANVPRRRPPPPRDGVGGPTEALPSGAPDDQA
ncbi:MAG TPA: hypothetical protein VFW63_10025, partial [Acidimicrobiales bacterium]|nr:hypothetical protein [Acidimicrobiales bacterium]